MPKARFAVYKTNSSPAYTMAFTCDCGEPGIAYSDDMKGLFVGSCGKGHEVSVMAS
ncbi:hypothetical protein [Nonomuraea sp. NPDC050786]|uniref:hypothetical protein n=1 Tax=Nonomuraea sp. NPDC050786 TaxID=3154840 RepID=UPI0033C8E696